MRIGILGGTFNPPHNGHLKLAEEAQKAFDLEEVIFMPAYRNPLKDRKQAAPAKHRMEMVKRLVANHPNFAVSDLEVSRAGYSYAVETMAELQFVRPADYWFILGADALKSLPQWRQPARLLKLCRLAVTVRPPISPTEVLLLLPPELRSGIDIFDMPGLELSASELRNKVAQGKSIAPWVPATVIQYIQEHKLYQV